MKYTIEIDTDKVFTDGQNNKLYRAKGFNSLVFDKCGLDKLEPIEKTWESELEKHRKQAYNEGYNIAISDYNMMIEWWNDWPEDFEKFLFEVYGLSDCKIENISLLYDIICSWDLSEVISEFKKWQEEKKKADEEIKVGDVVKFNEKCHNYDHVKSREFLVLHIFDNGLVTLLYDNGDTGAADRSLLDKTSRHIDEVEQLFDKLRGEEE